MKLLPYRLVTANSPDELQTKCNDVLFVEDEDDGMLFYYAPFGAPIVKKDLAGNVIFMQTFVMNSKPLNAIMPSIAPINLN